MVTKVQEIANYEVGSRKAMPAFRIPMIILVTTPIWWLCIKSRADALTNLPTRARWSLCLAEDAAGPTGNQAGQP